MSFYEDLKSSGINLAQLAKLQDDFLLENKRLLNDKKDSLSYREYYDRDQRLTVFETFVHRLERESLNNQNDMSDKERMEKKTDFTTELISQGVDLDAFISVQHEFIQFYQKINDARQETNYREYLEHDQVLTIYEKYIRRIEGETIQQKIDRIKGFSYPA